MKKEYPVDVICQFTAEGKMIPIKFRIKEEEYKEFRIISYNEKYRHLEYRQGFLTDYQIVSEIDYTCRVWEDEEREIEKEVCLRYCMREMRWRYLIK